MTDEREQELKGQIAQLEQERDNANREFGELYWEMAEVLIAARHVEDLHCFDSLVEEVDACLEGAKERNSSLLFGNPDYMRRGVERARKRRG